MNALTKKLGFIQLSDPDGLRALSALYAQAPSATPGHLILKRINISQYTSRVIATFTC